MQSGGQKQKPIGGNAASQLVQRCAVKPAGQQGCAALRGSFPQQQVAGQGGKLAQHSPYVLAPGIKLVEQQQRRLRVAIQNVPHQLGGLQITCKSQHFQHGPAVHRAACRGALVQKAQAVPQGAIRQTGEQLRAVGRQVDLLLLGHIGQPPGNVLWQNSLERVTLTPGEDGGRHLVQLRGGQNEHQVGGRFLQNFQQSVESRRGQHMNLVHDIDPLFHIGRGIDSLVPQGAHLIHAVVGGGIQFQHIQKAAAFQPNAAGALAAGIAVDRVFAVDGLGQNFGTGGLASAAGAGEQVGMRGAPLRHLLFQGLGDMFLPDHVGEHLGSPFAVQRLIHGTHPPLREYGKNHCIETSSVCRHGTGVLAAHGTSRLMLLGSPPDMVHGAPLRETGSASASGG